MVERERLMPALSAMVQMLFWFLDLMMVECVLCLVARIDKSDSRYGGTFDDVWFGEGAA